jgi:hypothetical protein
MRIVVVLLALLAPAASWAQFFDGNELLVMCSSQDRSFAQGGCVGFIAGVSDTLKAAENRRGLKERICVPGQLTTVEVKDEVIKYLKLVPQFHDYVGTFLVEMALRSAYPCATPEVAGTQKAVAAKGS